ncbi:ATP citrate synthase [Candidatus Woesearchaeota archaeon]|nr:ATP citrate synthase [Candidatus Woesearchaeota archaeon]
MNFTKTTQAIFYNLKAFPIQQMLDFDYVCQRTLPSIAAIVHPGRNGVHKAFFGAKEITLPVYESFAEAAEKHPQADVLINFASFRSAFTSSKEALSFPSIKTAVIVAEGVPERETKELIALAQKEKKMVIGPSTVGGIAAGSFRIGGYAGGGMENLLRARLYRPGSVGLVSKSGGMMNELFNILARATDGIKEGIAIGGDLYPGSTLLDHMLRFEADLDIKLIVGLGELGGRQEYEIIEAKKTGKLTKPILMWVTGTCASLFPWEVQFGHAGAKAGKEEESAAAKNKALREAGILVPASFEDLEKTLAHQYQHLVQQGIIIPAPESQRPSLPLDFDIALKRGLIRKATHFTTTISSDIGEEPTYGTIPVSAIIKQNYSLGEVIGLLWFKKSLPPYFSKFLELCLVLCADHGPAVSGAHNAIVAARAGKDVISALCSGLLTIGPRFGGAIDDASRYFKDAVDKNISPEQFVEEMKQKRILIPGIGHLVKSKRNPDKRVELLKDFARKNLPNTEYLNYALKVEKITTQKAENLILNVDGCLGALFVDALVSCGQFNAEEINEMIEIGYMNGLFGLARSIGLIGHILDQKRLKEPLYRHPTEDIFYRLE